MTSTHDSLAPLLKGALSALENPVAALQEQGLGDGHSDLVTQLRSAIADMEQPHLAPLTTPVANGQNFFDLGHLQRIWGFISEMELPDDGAGQGIVREAADAGLEDGVGLDEILSRLVCLQEDIDAFAAFLKTLAKGQAKPDALLTINAIGSVDR